MSGENQRKSQGILRCMISGNPDKVWTRSLSLFHFISFYLILLISQSILHTIELKWLEHLWDYENFVETVVVRASEVWPRNIIWSSFRCSSKCKYAVCTR